LYRHLRAKHFRAIKDHGSTLIDRVGADKYFDSLPEIQLRQQNDSLKHVVVYLTAIPKRLSEGRVLMHNHVRHTIDFPAGLNGFRFWTDTEPNPGFHSL
jgi:hypothetical protein